MQGGDPVAVLRRDLVFLALRRARHRRRQFAFGVGDVALQHPPGALDQRPVFLRRNAVPAGGDAAPHLVVDAGAFAPDLLGEFAAAGGKRKDPLHRVERLVRRRRGLVGTEISALVVLALSGHGQRGVFAPADLDIGIGLRVLQFDVVFRGILLDQDVFEGQRLHFPVAEDVVEVGDARDHPRRLDRMTAPDEVARHAVFQFP